VSARIIRTYYAITFLFNLVMSLIWGIDTLFKLGAGLDIRQVLLTNAAFTVGSLLFEIPTGVVADTVGRRSSLLLCLTTLFVATLLYVVIAWRGGGFAGFLWASALLGLGYTFYTGAVDAWLVDALRATGYQEALEPVFARGHMFFGAAMLVGTISGGLLGQSISICRILYERHWSCRCSGWRGSACRSSVTRAAPSSSGACPPRCTACSWGGPRMRCGTACSVRRCSRRSCP
jgi:MFS family permease